MHGTNEDQQPSRNQDQSPNGANFQHVVDSFLMDRNATGISKRTIPLYTKELAYFSKFLQREGIVISKQLTAPVVRKYLAELGTHRNPGGCHLAYRILKSLTYLWESELEDDYTSPMRKVTPKLSKELLPPADRGEIRQMIYACDGPNPARDKAILYCLLDTGCRAVEFLSIDREDLDVAHGSIHVRRGKGGKDRTVMIGKPSRKALRAYRIF
jgi:site-specific recombinase XerD